jgi:hypothetical protein
LSIKSIRSSPGILKDGLTNDWEFRQLKLTNWVDIVAEFVVVGIFVVKLFVPVHTLLFAWTIGNVVKFWEFKVVKFTNWFAVDAVIVLVGKFKLKVFVPVHTLLFAWTKVNVVKPWLFKVKKLTSWLLIDAVREHKGIELKVLTPFILSVKLFVLSTKFESI